MRDVVVPLYGAAPPSGEPDQEIVEMLERYLDQAKRGEIDGLAVALSRPNGNGLTEWVCNRGDATHTLHSSAVRLAHEMTALLSEQAR